MRHKLDKEHIISNALSKFASTNKSGCTVSNSEFDTLFVYHTTLVGIHLNLISYILESYVTNNWWVQI